MSCLKISATCSPSTLQRPSPGTHRVSPYPHLIKCPPSTHGILVWWSDATRINAQPFSRTSHYGRLPHNLSCRQWNKYTLPFFIKRLEDNSKSNPLSRYYVPNQRVGHQRSKITKNTSSSCWTISRLSLTQPSRLSPRVFSSRNLSVSQFLTHRSRYLLRWMDLILMSISILNHLFFLNQQFITRPGEGSPQ